MRPPRTATQAQSDRRRVITFRKNRPYTAIDVRRMKESFIDPYTSVLTKVRQSDGQVLALVMSDEFRDSNRGFQPGEDLIFEALERPDDSNESIVFYNGTKDYITTKDDCLVISTKAVKTSWHQWEGSRLRPVEYTKNYTSAMIQSWNKFCFTGGILELSIQLPGGADGGGIWPAVWLMGNLARATFPESTVNMWPWSYDTCIPEARGQQEVSACNPSPGFGLNAFQGRGAPEIDILEVMPEHSMPGQAEPIRAFMSSSLQIAPGIARDRRPHNGHRLNSSTEWYDGLFMGPDTDYNYGFWGQECGPEHDPTPGHIHKYMEDAISGNTFLNASHFTSQHVYKLEWQPGSHGYLHWYVDDQHVFGINGSDVHAKTGAVIPVEPMYMILNTAISHRWGMPEPCPVDTCSACWHCYDCTNPECQCSLPDGLKGCKNLPAEMKVDYIRLYQDVTDSSHSLGCSTKSFPSAEFIAAHAERYADWHSMSPQALLAYYCTVGFALVTLLTVLGYVLFRVLLCCRGQKHKVDRSQYTSIA